MPRLSRLPGIGGPVQLERGSYTGTGAGQSIAVAFRPRFVSVWTNAANNRSGAIVTDGAGATRGLRVPAAGGSAVGHDTGQAVTITASGFDTTAAGDADVLNAPYEWLALG